MEEGQTFPEFLMCCARAFGPLISMRDADTDTPIPEKIAMPSYHTKALEEAHAELARLKGMTTAEKKAIGEADKKREIEYHTAAIERRKEENARLNDMVARITAWTPPSSDHEGLKQFMLQQIGISYHRESDYHERALEAAKVKTVRSYYTDLVEAAVASIKYHLDHVEEEKKSNTASNDWLRLLRESLPAN